MKLLFATHNQHKVDEIQEILKQRGLPGVELRSLTDVNDQQEIPEDGDTLEANALQKAYEVLRRYSTTCFADDTGLEVEVLNGAPGVYSARYAGPECKAEDNVRKLLKELEGESNRTARFRTVIALLLDGEEYLFEGEVKGEILTKPRGEGGFGYDPIFRPDGFEQSFAEMSSEEKNRISHRYRATNELANFLAKYLGNG
ncbi:MAG: RdgB/HAM1 family non-canonical purine NTP pyrophosphatase [Porphyromonas sp.]|nr:RdgB/HAM1 family non-canonical purine NTP pyrophosphatase [Porphyromonas sp.]